MEYNELRRLTRKTVLKATVIGLVGLASTVGAMSLVDSKEHKSTVGAAGLYLSCLAAGCQFFRAQKEYY